MANTPKGLDEWDILKLDGTSGDWLSYWNVTHSNGALPGSIERIDPLGDNDYRMLGSTLGEGKAYLTIDLEVPGWVSLPDSWTALIKFKLENLPNYFSTLAQAYHPDPASHLSFRVNKDAYRGTGLNIAQSGMAFLGSFDWIQSLSDSAKAIALGADEFYYLYLAHSEISETTFVVLKTPAGTTFREAFTSKENILGLIGLSVLACSFKDEVRVVLDSLYVGTGVFLDWRAPICKIPTDRGYRLDSNTNRNNVTIVDGRESYDILGANLAYNWDLVEAPEESAASYPVIDGYTDPHVDPFTDTVKKPAIGDECDAGDWILYDTGFYKITGTFPGADFITVDTEIFPTGTPNIKFRIIRNFPFLDPFQGACAVALDAPGPYILRLTVDNGVATASEYMHITAREADTRTGETIDASWMWSYFSDIWDRVEDKKPVEEYFNALCQQASSLLVQAWQTEYANNLGTIQPFHSYRWMMLDTGVGETGTTEFVPGYASVSLEWPPGHDISAQTTTIRLHDGKDGYTDIPITFPAGTNTLQKAIEYLTSSLSSYPITAHEHFFNPNNYLYIKSPCLMEIVGGAVFTLNASNLLGYNTCINGTIIGTRTYQLPISAIGLDLNGHFVVIRGEPYKIIRISDIAAAPLRVLHVDRDLPIDLPVGYPTSCWIIPSFFRSNTDYYNELVFSGDTLKLLGYDTDGAESTHTEKVIGVLPDCIGTKSPVPSNTFYESVVIKKAIRTFFYPLDEQVYDIPLIQTKITPTDTATQLIKEGIGYILNRYRDKKCIHLSYYNPPTYSMFNNAYEDNPIAHLTELMFAEEVVIDNKDTMEANFGHMIGLDFDENVTQDAIEYFSAVRGLWFVFSKGRTVENLRKGINIFFALSFAQRDGVIRKIQFYRNSRYGRMIVEDKDNEERTRTYLLNNDAGLAENPRTGASWAVGDEIYKLERISGGAEVKDIVSHPNYYQRFGGFDEEVNPLTAYHRFHVRVSAVTFNQEKYGKFMEFVMKWRPYYLLPFVTIVLNEVDDISVQSSISCNVTLALADTPAGYWVLMFDDFDADGFFYKFDDGYKFDTWIFYPKNVIYADKTYTFAGSLKYDTVLKYDGADGHAWKYDQAYVGVLTVRTTLVAP